MPTNKFIQWNPTKANQESDTAYAADSQRSGGAANPSIWDSVLANKVLYQLSTMVAAIGQAITDGGHDANDAVLNDLVTALEVTWAKLNGSTAQAFSAADGSSGKQVVNISQFSNYLALPGYQALSGGLILTFQTVDQAGRSTNTYSLPVVFPHAGLAVFVSLGSSLGAGVTCLGADLLSTSTVQVTNTDLNSHGFYIFALGW
jgi:hypothetical protein